MIKLTAEPQPSELTEDLITKLTKKYKQNTNISVWRDDLIKESIRNALSKMSHNKCCFCESSFDERGRDLQVEHFFPNFHSKGDDVLTWHNLLPACIDCNRKKGKLDTQKFPLIHPVDDTPKNHIGLNKSFGFFDKDKLGEFTIEKLELNDETLSVDRFILGKAILSQLNDLAKEFIKELNQNLTLDYKEEAKFARKLRNIMQFGTPSKKYSAVMSTLILSDENYKMMKAEFIKRQLWTPEFIELKKQIEYSALLPEKN